MEIFPQLRWFLARWAISNLLQSDISFVKTKKLYRFSMPFYGYQRHIIQLYLNTYKLYLFKSYAFNFSLINLNEDSRQYYFSCFHNYVYVVLLIANLFVCAVNALNLCMIKPKCPPPNQNIVRSNQNVSKAKYPRVIFLRSFV